MKSCRRCGLLQIASRAHLPTSITGTSMQFAKSIANVLFTSAAMTVAVGAVAADNPGTSLAKDTEGTVVVRTTGGLFEQELKKNFFEPFTKATGIRVIPVAVSYGEMMAKSKAMQQAGAVEWDIISPQYDELPTIKDMLTDLGDCSSLPNVASQGIPQTCGRYGVLYVIGARPMVYDAEKFGSTPPQGWADFWDTKKYPGPRALPNDGQPWLEMAEALIADGVPTDKLFPLDVDRALKKLDQIKPSIQVWWKTGDQSQQLMRNREVVMNAMFSGRAFASKKAGVPINWTFNGALADWGSWAILKGAPHPKAAKAFIDFYMSNPQAHAAFSRSMGYATPNKEGQALLTPDERNLLVATPENIKKIVHVDAAWLEKNRAETVRRWNEWISK